MERKKVYMGFDCGGTKTEIVISDEKGNLLEVLYGGSANYTVLGVEKFTKNIVETLNKSIIMKRKEYILTDISIGLAGTNREKKIPKLQKALYNELNKFEFSEIRENNILLESDAESALRGRVVNNYGAGLIAGTGAIGISIDESGGTHYSSGRGYLVGDEGSGFWIGQQGIRAAIKYSDGRGDSTILLNALGVYFNNKNGDISKIIKDIYSSANPVPLIAGFAYYVIEGSKQNDKVSQQIVYRAILELAKSLFSVVKYLEGVVPVVFMGGILNKSAFFRESIKMLLVKRFPDKKFIFPEDGFPASVGALLKIFYKKKKSEIDEIINLLKSTIKKLSMR